MVNSRDRAGEHRRCENIETNCLAFIGFVGPSLFINVGVVLLWCFCVAMLLLELCSLATEIDPHLQL